MSRSERGRVGCCEGWRSARLEVRGVEGGGGVEVEVEVELEVREAERESVVMRGW